VNEESRTPLFAAAAAEAFRSRWQDIQASFVDEPQGAVEQADSLVAEVMQQLATTFADERAQLEVHGDHGEGISTEDLRMALRRYRSFFDRLLSI
jgi:membrane-anchored protein YejM (alkaline phosphatase superfamily)